MNVSELKVELQRLNIPPKSYSINGNLVSDTYYLNSVYGNWECFYFDERGVRREYKKFIDEDVACKYLLSKLKDVYVNDLLMCESNDNTDRKEAEVIYL